MSEINVAEINRLAKGDPMAMATELVKVINGLEAERAEARKIARMFIGYTGTPCAQWLVDRHPSLDALPDWLTAETEAADA